MIRKLIPDLPAGSVLPHSNYFIRLFISNVSLTCWDTWNPNFTWCDPFAVFSCTITKKHPSASVNPAIQLGSKSLNSISKNFSISLSKLATDKFISEKHLLKY